ncbi:MAG: RsmB/NOP family class I SAM-dependent RNA methyltransferase [Candidatus Lokiarchaeota archaeon]|nr:RsmB/NOP family class I SAM-dependent RNA methyltransferase [Candidatus Lokiarchaeota archaeon]
MTYRYIFEDINIRDISRELSKEKTIYFEPFLNKVSTFSWQKALVNKSNLERLSIQEAIPNFLFEKLLPVISMDFIKETINYININQKNNLLYVRTDVPGELEQFLDSNNISFTHDKDIKGLFVLPSETKKNCIESQLYKTGRLHIQDKASISVVKALNPQPGDYICDLSAAPGIKTLLISDFSNNLSEIIGLDFSFERTRHATILLNRQKRRNIMMINADGIEPPFRNKKRFDKILLDAPCTGSGALASHPELKWRQSSKFLAQCVSIQKKLLQSALRLVKKGGILVYSTCSLYPEEGEFQIKEILNQVTPLTLPNWFSPSYTIERMHLPGTGRLFPSKQKTQGFFVGKFLINQE